MKPIKRIGLCLMAIFAFSAVAAAGASATEILFELPTGSNFPAGFTVKPGPTIPVVLKTPASTVTCTSGAEVAAGGGKIENAHLGLTLILLKKCSTTVLGIKLPCSNAGVEELRIDLTWHLGLALPGNVRALLFLLPGGKFSFSCTSSAKIEMRGEVIGQVTPNKEATMGGNTNVILKFESSGGAEKFSEFQLQLGGSLMSKIALEISLNGGSFETGTVDSEGTGEKFTDSAGKAIEVSESLV